MVTLTAFQTPFGIKFLNTLSTGDDYWIAWFDTDEYQFGSSGNDTMFGAGGDDWLAGGTGNDDIYGGAGTDNLFGGSGNDKLIGGSGLDQLYGGDGHDLLINSRANPVMSIAAVSDIIFDLGGFMDGGSGNDTFRVDVFFNGQLAIDGGADADTIDFSQQTNDWPSAPPSGLPTNLLDLESLIGETPLGGLLTVTRVENIIGGEYRDEFYGNDGINSLRGLTNADVLEGRGGADTLDGGLGHDVAQYRSAASGVEVDMARITQTLLTVRDGVTVSNGDAAGDRLVSIEELRGSIFADILRGKSGGGLPSNEALYGDGGNDLLEGRYGADILDGGAGFDFASYQSSSAAVNVSIPRLGYANAQFGDAAGDTLLNIEALIGSSYSDTLIGNNDRNELRGGNGGDLLSGLGGNDTLKGGAGIDSIAGGAGRDVMYGEAGADSFTFFSVLDSNGTFKQRDLIQDFTRDILRPTGLVLGDTIDLSAIDANQRAGTTGNQAFNFIGGEGFSEAGQVRVTSGLDASGRMFNIVQVEVTGDKVVDFSVSIYTTNNTLLSVSDFLL